MLLDPLYCLLCLLTVLIHGKFWDWEQKFCTASVWTNRETRVLSNSTKDCIIEALANPEKERMKHDDTTISSWLQSQYFDLITLTLRIKCPVFHLDLPVNFSNGELTSSTNQKILFLYVTKIDMLPTFYLDWINIFCCMP